MATLTINFQANTIGNHIIAYKTYNEPFPVVPLEHVIIVENVVTPGPQSVDINVAGNLYCGEVTYDGYVVASCLLNDEATLISTGIPDVSDDAGANGIPDVATTFSVLMEKQVDPCVFATITCDNVPIGSITIDNPGTNYLAAEALIFTVPGGDELVPAVAEISGVGGSGEIDGITITNPGSYKSIPVITINTASGVNGALTAVMQPCPVVNLTSIQCLNDDANPAIYSLELTESFSYCVDIGTVAGTLGAQFEIADSDFCHCRECTEYSVENTDTNPHTITFQTCWDEDPDNIVTTTAIIPATSGVINLGCGVKDTVVKSSPFLIVTTAVCS
jgi:hypothetical protein